jgi:hypothetical protein
MDQAALINSRIGPANKNIVETVTVNIARVGHGGDLSDAEIKQDGAVEA